MQKSIRVKVIKIKQESPDTKTFRLDLGKEEFDFKPGQFILAKITMRETKDFKVLHGKSKTQTRAYSISSPPYEKNFLEITVKEIEDGFVSKYFNKVLKVGDVFEITGPFGKFTISEDESNIVLIGAGCGVVPFRSILLNVQEKKLPTKVVLLDTNKTPEDVLYYDKFKELCRKNDNMSCYFTITRPWLSKTKWKGPTGRLNAEAIKKNIKDYKSATYYLCGPPEIIESMEKILRGLRVPKEKIKSEKYGCL